MKFIIGYLLIGVILQILFAILYIISKPMIDDMIKITEDVIGRKPSDEKTKWKMAQSPKSIFLNIITWPFNVGLAIYNMINFFR